VPSLLLHPDQPDWVPEDQESLLLLLEHLGLICTTSHTTESDALRLGHRFLALVTFLGCSPRVVIDRREAEEGQPVCRLRYHSYPQPRFLSARRRPAVRCPYCRAEARGVLPKVPDAPFSCPQCGRLSKVHALDWRHSAGFARCFLEVTNVYPHEAVPSDSLMESLGGYSGSFWRYFYGG
jgi:hypothetical protein